MLRSRSPLAGAIHRGRCLSGMLALLALAPASRAVAAYPVYIDAVPSCLPVGEAVTFGASSADLSDPGTTVSWDFGDGTVTSERAPTHSFATTGLRRVSVTALGTSGMAIAERPVFVLPRRAIAQPSCRIFSLSPISVLSPRDGLTLVEGRALLPNGEGAPGVRVGLRSSAGAVVAILSTDSNGRFAFRRSIVGPSSWRLLFLDHPGSSGGPREFVVRPRVVIRPPKTPVGSGRDLTVRGHLEPRLADKLVQLEFQTHGAWRPVIQSHTRLGGAFVLRYRFSAAPGRYEVRMRVAVPRDRGWPGPGAASRPFTVKVNG